MTWEKYLPLAEKTLSGEFYTDKKTENLLHAIVGTLTEIDEIFDNYQNGLLITDVNKQGSLAEEVGDVFWYVSILFRDLNIDSFPVWRKYENEFKKSKNILLNFMQSTLKFLNPFSYFPVWRKHKNGFNILLNFMQSTLKFLDLLKKKLYYDKEIFNDKMVDNAKQMYTLLMQYCMAYDIDVDKVLDKNIAKLKARYGEKFTSERAINRDLEIEKNILEN